MRRKDRIDYKYREDGGIRAYDAEKGTNITEEQIWSGYAVPNTLTASTPPLVIVKEHKPSNDRKE